MRSRPNGQMRIICFTPRTESNWIFLSTICGSRASTGLGSSHMMSLSQSESANCTLIGMLIMFPVLTVISSLQQSQLVALLSKILGGGHSLIYMRLVPILKASQSMHAMLGPLMVVYRTPCFLALSKPVMRSSILTLVQKSSTQQKDWQV